MSNTRQSGKPATTKTPPNGSDPWERHKWIVTTIIAVAAAIGTIYQGWIARDTERRSLRAYVLVVPDSAKWITGDAAGPALEFWEKDGGNTPACCQKVRGAFEVHPVNPLMDYSVAHPEADWGEGKIDTRTLAPGEKYRAHIDVEGGSGYPRAVDAQRIAEGKAVLVFQGVITSQDVFESRHRSEICIFFTSVANGAMGQVCRNHNGFD
jgi:hypothetical protein